MARVVGKGSRSLQQWRPQTDYERWLEEHNENYQPGPRQRADSVHSTQSDITHLQSYKPHGEFLRQVSAGPPSALGDALADSARGHCPYQLDLFFVVVIALLQIAKYLEKRRRRAAAPSIPGQTVY
ncbi:uncharacterized protein BDW43DRAFT_312047 [Aspergillus alliaceus]|uniref:uncharacterized protein n=1 Tax=Petromyces alliaceus TaxID=209559 RepID=UPI0012A45346|nr:uncharacterized protein BDW43DRAFT_312047 [Aspergillus alliaceus]KAB8232361.1 hypothetical protein BDW43DRAFT_312047 [Aspergillus alliaceus]